jgi:hypothetical protein
MHLSPNQLDEILTRQLQVAWAGEGSSEPPRLGWWSTAAIDDSGGGELLRRLAPRTGQWSALVLVREAARRTEAAMRARLAQADRAVGLFHLGFDLDEKIGDRLAEHRRGGAKPADVMPGLALLDKPLDTKELASVLGAVGRPAREIEPVGRRLQGAPPSDPVHMAALLAAALVPGRGEEWPTAWPMPFYRV